MGSPTLNLLFHIKIIAYVSLKKEAEKFQFLYLRGKKKKNDKGLSYGVSVYLQ